MPANVKYLAKSGSQRFAKITAAFVGGLLLSTMIHLAAGAWLGRKAVTVTALYTGFLLWAGLAVVAYLIENGWLAWALYLLGIILFGLLAYMGGAAIPGFS